MFSIAEYKATSAHATLSLQRAAAFRLPYAEQSFDLVVSSLVLHHLTTTQKHQTLAEMYRVLKPGGRFLVVDFGTSHTQLSGFLSTLTRYLEQTKDNFNGRLREMFDDVGFVQVEEPAHVLTPLGTLTLYSGQ